MKFSIICCYYTCDPKAVYLINKAVRKVIFVNGNKAERRQSSSMFGKLSVYHGREG